MSAGLQQRCTNPNAQGFEYYGGRGIKFLFSCFAEFYLDVGQRPTPEHSIDRINNDGHYEPGNVRWATRSMQNSNKRPPSAEASSCAARAEKLARKQAAMRRRVSRKH
jgi:hypothetical protein